MSNSSICAGCDDLIRGTTHPPRISGNNAGSPVTAETVSKAAEMIDDGWRAEAFIDEGHNLQMRWVPPLSPLSA